MAKAISRSVLMLAGMSLIAGCQSIGGIRFSHRIDADRLAAERNRTLFTLQGADQIRAGNNGQAIEAYNLALATGEEPAPAYNGLGVAYARLGRPDLAYRFFKKATMGAPDNVVFARNLARLMDSPDFAVEMAKRAERRRFAEPGSDSGAAQTALAQPIVREPGRLYRDSNGQISLITLSAPAVRFAAGHGRDDRSCPGQARGGRTGRCVAAGLPRTESRIPRSDELAMNRADARTALPPPVTAGAGADDRQGKRKVVEMPAPARLPARAEGSGQTAS